MFYRQSFYALAALVLGAQAAASLDLGQLGENLKAELEKNPDFRALTPAGLRLGRIELESDISPGPLVWGESAEPLGLIPVGKGSTPFVNCAYDSTRIGRQLIEASHTDTYSFSTTDSSSLAVEVGVEANWPMVSVSGKVTGTVSSSSSESTGQGKTLVLSSQIEGPIPPRHYFEVSVVAYERRIANQPFHVNVEITGNARLHYVPTTSWRAVGARREAPMFWPETNLFPVATRAGIFTSAVSGSIPARWSRANATGPMRATRERPEAIRCCRPLMAAMSG